MVNKNNSLSLTESKVPPVYANELHKYSFSGGGVPPTVAKKTILIVDDVAINRNILKRILKKYGFDTVEAENGKLALDLLLSGKPSVDLMLLDLNMPVMSGYDLLTAMKETGFLTSVPVIVITGSEQDNAEILSLERGASDFITKPYKPDLVYHRVRSILRLCENAALINRLETDRLTGIYTREFFYRHAEAMLDEHPDRKYDILCSNIENFKSINSKYGMEVGDELLRSIAKHNAECVGPDGVCGRLGADTFVALRPRINPRSQEEVAKLFQESFGNAPIKSFVMQYGLFQVEDRSLSVPQMCDYAQLALSTIKHKYGVYYAVYDDSMRCKFLREQQLSDHMEQALSEKQFLVYLQPKHDIITGAIAGAEALVRWIHPELGFISPGEFIPLFERNGFITKLDRYVWNEVCRIIQRWLHEERQTIPISVNVSRTDFDEGDLPEYIGQMAEKYAIPPKYLHLEVTESAYTNDPKKIISAISTLRDMGFLIEMDDFGSGYSSLNMLSELPIDILKLDMRFMQGNGEFSPTGKRSILSFIMSLSKWMQLPTIAEGVKSKEDVDLLRSMGCNYAQGYYYAKPMPIADFEIYMKSHTVLSQTKKMNLTERLNLRTSDSDDASKPQVLIVEDIAGNRELLRNILSPYYKVYEAPDGKQAYAYLTLHRANISCILLDLLMPGMDCFQFIELIHKESDLAEIPVIIISESSADSELRAIRLGADGFVAKPYNADILLYRVQTSIQYHQYRKICENSNREKDSTENKQCNKEMAQDESSLP